MPRSRSIIIVGAGIGGLTVALALARAGFRTAVLEQAMRLEETGAGIQLSPNASRILLALGLGDRLRPHVVAPEAMRVVEAQSGRDIVRVALGAPADARFGAPFWLIHRADLQAVLVAAAEEHPDIELRLGTRVEELAHHANGVTADARAGARMTDEHGIALIGADGLWSTIRRRLGDGSEPRFAQRTAWRAVVPSAEVTAEFREAATSLWLGPGAHLVHYPVKGGAAINIVAIVGDTWREPGWSAPGRRDDLLARFGAFAPSARALLALPERWQKWALFDRRAPWPASPGAITLLGDAAHPVLPFLAQGGAMAIEDAAVLASCLAGTPNDPTGALRTYERTRRTRTARVERESRKNGQRYHWAGARAFVRDAVLRSQGGEKMLSRYEWLYDWRP